MATTKIAKKLPKRTGKAQKVRMMEQSKTRSAEKKHARDARQHEAMERNYRVLATLVPNVWSLTKTQRRRLLARHWEW